jgi:soluble P-type ATPase
MAKRDFLQELGTETSVVIGNGRNDAQMLQFAEPYSVAKACWRRILLQ